MNTSNREKIKKIKLSKGQFSIVDSSDYVFLSKYKWCSTRNGTKTYAKRTENKKTIYMHKEITKYNFVDHINGNGLDNRRKNLRSADKSKNAANRGKSSGSYSSKYKGIHFNKLNKNWRARISKKGKNYEVGSFSREEDARIAVNKKYKELFGEFAKCP